MVPAAVWLRELPAIQVLRVVLLQNYYVHEDNTGKQVVRRRDADKDGIPPALSRITSPYDTDARWAAKGEDLFWNGYKVHLTETCQVAAPSEPGVRQPDPPNVITNVATTDATVPDVAMTAQIHAMLADRSVIPAEHYLDSGYPSAALLLASRTGHGIELVTSLLADSCAQAKAGAGYDRSAFAFGFQARTATCPQGQRSAVWTACVQEGTAKIVVTFPAAGCIRCPARHLCTRRKKGGRQVTVPPQEVHDVQAKARAQ